LNPGGNFQGTGDLYAMGIMQPCQVAGRWNYDHVGKVFWVQGMINGVPPAFEEYFRLTGGGNGYYSATISNGLQFGLQRM
jgi:hypothetical protein